VFGEAVAARVIWRFAPIRPKPRNHYGLSVMETVVEPPMAERVWTYSRSPICDLGLRAVDKPTDKSGRFDHR